MPTSCDSKIEIRRKLHTNITLTQSFKPEVSINNLLNNSITITTSNLLFSNYAAISITTTIYNL